MRFLFLIFVISIGHVHAQYNFSKGHIEFLTKSDDVFVNSPKTIKVKITNKRGRALEGRTVKFKVTRGNANNFLYGTRVTDENGFASNTMQTGDKAGTVVISVTTESALSATTSRMSFDKIIDPKIAKEAAEAKVAAAAASALKDLKSNIDWEKSTIVQRKIKQGHVKMIVKLVDKAGNPVKNLEGLRFRNRLPGLRNSTSVREIKLSEDGDYSFDVFARKEGVEILNYMLEVDGNLIGGRRFKIEMENYVIDWEKTKINFPDGAQLLADGVSKAPLLIVFKSSSGNVFEEFDKLDYTIKIEGVGKLSKILQLKNQYNYVPRTNNPNLLDKVRADSYIRTALKSSEVGESTLKIFDGDKLVKFFNVEFINKNSICENTSQVASLPTHHDIEELIDVANQIAMYTDGANRIESFTIENGKETKSSDGLAWQRTFTFNYAEQNIENLVLKIEDAHQKLENGDLGMSSNLYFFPRKQKFVLDKKDGGDTYTVTLPTGEKVTYSKKTNRIIDGVLEEGDIVATSYSQRHSRPFADLKYKGNGVVIRTNARNMEANTFETHTQREIDKEWGIKNEGKALIYKYNSTTQKTESCAVKKQDLFDSKGVIKFKKDEDFYQYLNGRCPNIK